MIEAGGVGYELNIALSVYSELVGQENTTVKLFAEEIIREDTHLIFGFLTKPEREVFRLLTSVNGVGPNTARMILSTFSAGELRQLIATGNARQLASVKGLGPKTAQKIIVDLKDKILKVDIGADVTDLPVEAVVDSPVKSEAVSALTMLGFSAAASSKVVDKILADSPAASVEAVIRQALKAL